MSQLLFKRLDHCLENFIIRRDHGIYKLIRSYYLFKLWQTCSSWFQKKQRELLYRSWSSADNQDKGHDLNIASLALSKLPFRILTFSQFSLKVMQNGSKDVCCLSGRGQLQTDRELSTPNCHTAQVPGLCHHSLLNFWERQNWLFGIKDAIWQSLSQIVLLLSEFNSLGLSKFI